MNIHVPADELRAFGRQAGHDNLVDEVIAERAAARPSRRLWLWIALGVALLAAAIFGLTALAGDKAPPPADSGPPKISVVVPGRVAVADAVRVTGSIAARRDMPVGVQGDGGQVVSVRAEAGQFVRQGQVLAELDKAVPQRQAEQLAAGIEQARADARLSQSELDRAQQLVARGFISKADIDRRTATRDANNAKVKVAIAQLNEMRARIGRLDIRAPADGLVLQRSVEAGQVVSPASPAVFRIAKDGQFELRALVAEQDLARLRVGQRANVRISGGTSDILGQIWLLEPVIDQGSRQGLARVALPRDATLRVGAFARGELAAGTAMRPVVPQSAVLVDDAGSFVYVIDAANKVQRRGVKVGPASEVGIPIVAGLDGGERVVAQAGAFVRPGEVVAPTLTRAG